MAAVVSELTWLESFLDDLGVKLSSPATLFCDSQAVIHNTKNPVFHERTKHIEVDCHFIREKVQLKKIELAHVPAAQQVADILTKALPRHLYNQFLSKLGAYDLYAPAYGGVICLVKQISIANLIFKLHGLIVNPLLQFRLTNVAPESIVVGAGDLVD
ncbi:putative cyclic nucleotide-gated ion channel 19 [Platanthera zijinensis]|uniref:Cyclic nucleotide-gated ion channel 19 n=1 Tax=Platanthera zijinensis TaxID=2320716 RepID=A0AAP0BVM5_9ASPA